MTWEEKVNERLSRLERTVRAGAITLVLATVLIAGLVLFFVVA